MHMHFNRISWNLYKCHFEVYIVLSVGEKKTAQQVDGNHIMRENIEYTWGTKYITCLWLVVFFLINHSFLLIKQVLCLINCSGNLI